MSYVQHPYRALGYSPEECLNEANAKTADFDAQIVAKVRGWFPSGYYTQDELVAVIQPMLKLMDQQITMLEQSPRRTGSSDFNIKSAINDLARFSQRGMDFIRQSKVNASKGLTINDCPTLKSWVIHAMGAVSNGLTVVLFEQCETSTLQRIYGAISDLASRAADAIAGVPGLAADLVRSAADKVGKVTDAATLAVQLALYGGAAVLLYALYQRVAK